MSTPITTFEDLEAGQDLALSTNSTVSKWTWDGERMVNTDGHRVEPFFFSGALAQGRLVLANFAPPQVGEWFHRPTRANRLYLVVDITGEERIHSPMVATFVSGEFVGFTSMPNIVDQYERTEAPEWNNAAIRSLAVSAYGYHRRLEELQRQIGNIRTTRDYLRYTRDYLNSAITSLENTSR